LLEIPLEQAAEVGSFTERLAQESRDGHFTLKAFQLPAAEGKLEDAKFVRLGVFGKPYLLALRCWQGTKQAPVLPPGDHISGAETPVRLSLGIRRRPRADRYTEAVPDTGYRKHDRRIGVSQGFSELGYCRG